MCSQCDCSSKTVSVHLHCLVRGMCEQTPCCRTCCTQVFVMPDHVPGTTSFGCLRPLRCLLCLATSPGPRHLAACVHSGVCYAWPRPRDHVIWLLASTQVFVMPGHVPGTTSFGCLRPLRCLLCLATSPGPRHLAACVHSGVCYAWPRPRDHVIWLLTSTQVFVMPGHVPGTTSFGCLRPLRCLLCLATSPGPRHLAAYVHSGVCYAWPRPQGPRHLAAYVHSGVCYAWPRPRDHVIWLLTSTQVFVMPGHVPGTTSFGCLRPLRCLLCLATSPGPRHLAAYVHSGVCYAWPRPRDHVIWLLTSTQVFVMPGHVPGTTSFGCLRPLRCLLCLATSPGPRHLAAYVHSGVCYAWPRPRDHVIWLLASTQVFVMPGHVPGTTSFGCLRPLRCLLCLATSPGPRHLLLTSTQVFVMPGHVPGTTSFGCLRPLRCLLCLATSPGPRHLAAYVHSGVCYAWPRPRDHVIWLLTSTQVFVMPGHVPGTTSFGCLRPLRCLLCLATSPGPRHLAAYVHSGVCYAWPRPRDHVIWLLTSTQVFVMPGHVPGTTSFGCLRRLRCLLCLATSTGPRHLAALL